MGKLSSQPVIKRLKRVFGKKFDVTTESKNTFRFDNAYYQPDLVFRCKKSKKIKVLIEVEQCTRKHIVGGVISADYCMGKHKQKPVMLILALTEQDRKDYGKRVKMLKHYIKHLRGLFVGNEKEVVRRLRNI